MQLDLTDRKILHYLDKDARQGISKLAKKIHIGRNVALYRINKLKEIGIIKGSFAEINNPLLGYYTLRIFFKISNASNEEQEKLFSFILKYKEITWFSRVIGKWDLDILFMTKNIADFEIFRKEWWKVVHPNN